MKLIQEFKEPIGGYWDGGVKSRFEWEINGQPKTDSKGQFIKIGSWEANYWFHVGLGKTEKLTLSYAKKHLKSLAQRKNKECTFQYAD